MQKLKITRAAYKNHMRYSIEIQKILNHLVTRKDLCLFQKKINKKIELPPIKLNPQEINYFTQLLNLYNTTNFLLAKPDELNKLIHNESIICSNLGWKERPERINRILEKIFGYDEGFSKGKFVHLIFNKSKNIYTIQYSQNPPDGGCKWGAAKFLRTLKVKFCVYCNERSLYLDGNKHSHFDHFYKKSSYPFLALTLTNLVPSCDECNSSIKGTKDFTKENILNPYAGSFNNSVMFSILSKIKTKNDRLYILEQIISRKLSVKDLTIEEIANGDFPIEAYEWAKFFHIVKTYKKFDVELNRYIYNIYVHANQLLSVVQTGKISLGLKKITINDSFPEFFYNESDINKYRFEKIIIDLCKEAGIR